MQNLLDGLFYLVRTGCQWRHLPPPPAFPPWRTVYGYLRGDRRAIFTAASKAQAAADWMMVAAQPAAEAGAAA